MGGERTPHRFELHAGDRSDRRGGRPRGSDPAARHRLRHRCPAGGGGCRGDRRGRRRHLAVDGRGGRSVVFPARPSSWPTRRPPTSSAAVPGEPFDRVVSRFGVMFFDDPVAAFANIRAAVAPGAELAFACWRAEERDVFMSGLAPLAARMELPFAPPTVGVPGPLGLGTSVVIGDVLTEAGWFDVIVEALDVTLDYSFDGSDGVEERLAMALSGIARTIGAGRTRTAARPGRVGGAARRGPRRTAELHRRWGGPPHRPHLARHRFERLNCGGISRVNGVKSTK